MSEQLTKTLVVTLALPDVYVMDMTAEELTAWGWGEDVEGALYEELGLLSHTARLLLPHGDMGGNDIIESRAVILNMRVDDRTPEHDSPEDERLGELIDEWHEWEYRRVIGEDDSHE